MDVVVLLVLVGFLLASAGARIVRARVRMGRVARAPVEWVESVEEPSRVQGVIDGLAVLGYQKVGVFHQRTPRHGYATMLLQWPDRSVLAGLSWALKPAAVPLVSLESRLAGGLRLATAQAAWFDPGADCLVQTFRGAPVDRLLRAHAEALEHLGRLGVYAVPEQTAVRDLADEDLRQVANVMATHPWRSAARVVAGVYGFMMFRVPITQRSDLAARIAEFKSTDE